MVRKTVEERIRCAAANGDLRTLSRLADTRELVSNHDPETGRTNLAVAVDSGHTDICIWLWDHGAGISDSKLTSLDKDVPGGTIVHLATLHNHFKTLAAILDRFPDLIDWPDDKGQSALHLAARCGHFESMHVLLAPSHNVASRVVGENVEPHHHPADVNLPDDHGDTPLHLASAWGRQPLIVELMRTYNANGLIANLAGFTPADIAYDKETVKLVEELARSQSDSTKRRAHRQHRNNITATAALGSTTSLTSTTATHNTSTPAPTPLRSYKPSSLFSSKERKTTA